MTLGIKTVYNRRWMRVLAVIKCLFCSSAREDRHFLKEKLGNEAGWCIMGLQDCIQDFHRCLTLLNGLWEGFSFAGGIEAQGLLGLQTIELLWILIWWETEIAATKARRYDIKRLWISQDLQAEDKGIPLHEAAKEEFSAWPVGAAFQLKTQAFSRKGKVKIVKTFCDKRRQSHME